MPQEDTLREELLNLSKSSLPNYAKKRRQTLGVQNEVDENLLRACKGNFYDEVKTALQDGADPVAKDKTGKRAYLLVASKDDNSKEYVSNPSKEEAFRALSPSFQLVNYAMWGDIDKINTLLKEETFSISVLNRALIMAFQEYDCGEQNISGSHVTICEKLLKKGANPNFAFSPNEKTIFERIASKPKNELEVISEPMKQVFLSHLNKKTKNPEKKSGKEKSERMNIVF